MTVGSPQSSSPLAALTVTPASFEQELRELVIDTAPRMFAVVQVCDVDTELANGWVVAWGIAYEDGTTHVVSADGRLRMSFDTPERAIRPFNRTPDLTARLVWLAPSDSATLDQPAAAA